MIKLICPKCMKPVPVADDFTGSEVTCPNCMKTFDAPARYTPAVIAEPAPLPPVYAVKPPDVVVPSTPPPISPEPRMSPEIPSEKPVPPPGFVPPVMAPAPHAAPPGLVLASSTAASPTATPHLEGYTHAYGITISPKVIAWLPAVLLTITLFCIFFRWTGTYLGGHPVDSQSPLLAMGGWVSQNYALEEIAPWSSAWVGKTPSDWLILVPYIFLLLVATVIAWTDRVLQGQEPKSFPPAAKIWPWRKAFIGVLASLAFLLISIQLINGFSMERAIREMVRENPEIAKAREAAAGKPELLKKVEYREQTEMAKYNIEHTGWQDLALFCNLLAVVAVFLSIPLEKRGNKPPPRIMLHY